ncbi:MAG: hypothetical protein ACRC0Y_14440, partial [Fusobacteriaceae bacterium]
ITKIKTTGYSFVISYFDKKKIEIYFSDEYKQLTFKMDIDQELPEEEIEKTLLKYSQEARKEICGFLYDKYYISIKNIKIISEKTNFFKWLKPNENGYTYYNPKFYKIK